jgi:hypothetical protein
LLTTSDSPTIELPAAKELTEPGGGAALGHRRSLPTEAQLAMASALAGRGGGRDRSRRRGSRVELR